MIYNYYRPTYRHREIVKVNNAQRYEVDEPRRDARPTDDPAFHLSLRAMYSYILRAPSLPIFESSPSLLPLFFLYSTPSDRLTPLLGYRDIAIKPVIVPGSVSSVVQGE